MTYIDGFVLPVPKANKEAFIKYAEDMDPIFIELGALRVMECWGDDIPDGKQTDFRQSVKATDDETVVFSFVEWPDKETRDRAYDQMNEIAKTDERWDPEKNPMPLDGHRMFWGGFNPVFDLKKT